MTPKESDFHVLVERYVRDAAGGNKAAAAKMLKVKRLEIYRYLNGVNPRPALKTRLLAAMRSGQPEGGAGSEVRSDRVATGKEGERYVSVSLLIEMIQSMQRVIENEVGRQVASRES